MNGPLEVLVVTLAPISFWTVQHLLEGGPQVTRFQSLAAPDPASFSATTIPDMVILAPRNWHDMARWLPSVRRQLSSCPILVMADLPVSGMFSSFFEKHLCTFVGPGCTPRDFQDSFWSLASRQPLCDPAALLARLTLGLSTLTEGRLVVRVTTRQLQCGCAVSQGLENEQIAQILSVTVGTVKKHITNVMQKMRLADREALGHLFERALSPLASA